MVVDGEEIVFEEPAEFKFSSFWHWPHDTYSNEKLMDVNTVQIYVKIWNIEYKAKESDEPLNEMP